MSTKIIMMEEYSGILSPVVDQAAPRCRNCVLSAKRLTITKTMLDALKSENGFIIQQYDKLRGKWTEMQSLVLHRAAANKRDIEFMHVNMIQLTGNNNRLLVHIQETMYQLKCALKSCSNPDLITKLLCKVQNSNIRLEIENDDLMKKYGLKLYEIGKLTKQSESQSATIQRMKKDFVAVEAERRRYQDLKDKLTRREEKYVALKKNLRSMFDQHQKTQQQLNAKAANMTQLETELKDKSKKLFLNKGKMLEMQTENAKLREALRVGWKLGRAKHEQDSFSSLPPKMPKLEAPDEKCHARTTPSSGYESFTSQPSPSTSTSSPAGSGSGHGHRATSTSDSNVSFPRPTTFTETNISTKHGTGFEAWGTVSKQMLPDIKPVQSTSVLADLTVAEKESMIECLHEELGRLRMDLDAVRNDLDESRTMLTAEIERSEAAECRVKELQASSALTQQKLIDLQTQWTAMVEENADLSQRLSDAERQIAGEKETQEKLCVELQTAHTDYEILEGNSAKIVNELVEVKEHVTELKELLSLSNETLTVNQDANESLQAKLTLANREFEKQQAKITELTTAVESRKEDKKELLNKMEWLITERTTAMEKYTKLQGLFKDKLAVIDAQNDEIGNLRYDAKEHKRLLDQTKSSASKSYTALENSSVDKMFVIETQTKEIMNLRSNIALYKQMLQEAKTPSISPQSVFQGPGPSTSNNGYLGVQYSIPTSIPPPNWTHLSQPPPTSTSQQPNRGRHSLLGGNPKTG